MKNLLIFGAKSIALGVCLAIKELYPDNHIIGFLVTDKTKNPDILCHLPVMEVNSFQDKEIPIILAIPEHIQENVKSELLEKGFHQIISLNSKEESELMRCYYKKKDNFLLLKKHIAQIYMTRSHKDQPLKTQYTIPDWIYPIQAGAALSDKVLAKIADNTGENISFKNGNYCELTALYWIWKNRINQDSESEYYGIFQYRRILDITENDLHQLSKNRVDVVLPYPMISEPNIFEHHERYVKDSDWDAMMQALRELYPQFYKKALDIFNQQYMYNFNIFVARKPIFNDYCTWLFSILERTEELSYPKGNERSDRYIGYLGENLLTLYFMIHQEEFTIYHTGRLTLI